jgi:hypothetical protein
MAAPPDRVQRLVYGCPRKGIMPPSSLQVTHAPPGIEMGVWCSYARLLVARQRLAWGFDAGAVLGVVPSGPPLSLLPPLPLLRLRPQGIFEEPPDQRAPVR